MLVDDRKNNIERVVYLFYFRQLIFSVRQNNLDELERVLYDASDVASLNYGRHWSGEQVTALSSNPATSDAIVAYLTTNSSSKTETGCALSTTTKRVY
jgi:Pro-kumamolisin, activation domain